MRMRPQSAFTLATSLLLYALGNNTANSQCPPNNSKIWLSDLCYWESVGNPNSPLIGGCVARNDQCTGAVNRRSNGNSYCNGRFRCEPAAPMSCSGNLIPAGAHAATRTVQISENGSLGGIISQQFEVCQTLAPNKSAKKIYCQMYDHPNIIACNNDVNTSNSCPWTAFVRMKLNIVPGNKKQYCWVFNAESVGGRPRDFSIFVQTD